MRRPLLSWNRCLERESVFTCGPVMAELLAGTAPDRRDDLWLAIGSLPWAEIAPVRVAVDRRDRERPSSCGWNFDPAHRRHQIAVAAARAEAALWTTDRDFDQIQVVLPALEAPPTRSGLNPGIR